MIELQKDPAAQGLGISLTGNKDGSRARMSVYVADIDPQGPAGLDGRIRVGDELLEVRRRRRREVHCLHETTWSQTLNRLVSDKGPGASVLGKMGNM